MKAHRIALLPLILLAPLAALPAASQPAPAKPEPPPGIRLTPGIKTVAPNQAPGVRAPGLTIKDKDKEKAAASGSAAASGAPAKPPTPPVATPPATPPTTAPATPQPPTGAQPGPEPRRADTSGLSQFPDEVEFQPRPPGYRVAFSLEDANLSELVRVISQLTGKRFIFGGKVRDIKATVYSPQKVTVAEAYRAFLAILETNGLTVVPHGRFLKIVETPGVINQATPVYGSGQPVPQEERYMTRLYRLSHVSADEVAKLLTKFKSKDGDVATYPASNLLILTDTGSNIRRMLRLVEEVDVGGASNQIWVEQVHYAVASELSQKLGEIFDVSTSGGGGGGSKSAPAGANAPAGGGGETAESDTRISKIIAEDRTNSLIIVATEPAYLRVLEVVNRLDVQQTGDGDIHVLPLQHAMAEELAETLNNILTGMGGSSGGGGGGAGKGGGAKPAAGGGGGSAPEGIFEGAVKVTADKATNSLVITSSLRDYASLRTVIDRLDRPRRQVFIEAVIMDMSVDHSRQMGINYHAGAAPDVGGGGNSLIYGGLNPMTSILVPSAENLQGLALGVRGPGLEGSQNLLGTGITVPAFGVVINALATSGDANVLATPHIIATDNVAAEISVGENIPLQTNMGGMSGLSSMMGALGGRTGTAASSLGSLGMMGMGYGGGFSAPRQDVGTKIKVTPHINDSNQVRLELTEEISERGASSGALGAVSITKRTAETTVVVRDQQTVVIGGLMRDAVSNSEKKVPVLGDIPLLGFLFRSTDATKRKTNLLLILTPYIIRDQNDLRAIFERKMQERQEFLDRYFVFSDQKPYHPPQDFSRTNGLVEDIRQSMLAVTERRRMIEESKPAEVKSHQPGVPIEWVPQSSDGAPRSPGASPSPKSAENPSSEAPRPTSPVRVNVPPRSVATDQRN